MTTKPAIEVFMLRAECLEAARGRVLAGDACLQPALAALIDAADAALRLAPLSVMDKQRLPPSGDKHDYVSLAPYWWPDPQAPDGLPYIRRDGEVNPESREDSDRYRMETMLHAIETLALAYYFTDLQHYAEKAAVLLRHWFLAPATRMNPHLEFGQAIPGVTAGRDIGIIDTRCFSALIDSLGILQTSSALSATEVDGMRAWMEAYLQWLLTSNHGKGEAAQHNNHGTWYDVQVAALACYVGEQEVVRRVIAERATARLNAHLAADGAQPHELARTRSWDYSVMNLEGFAQLAELGRHVGLELWQHVTPRGGSLRMAIDFLAPYADPALAWPYPQITPVNRLNGLAYHLRRAILVFQETAYERNLSRLPAEALARHRVQLLYHTGSSLGVR